jgi:DNA-binding transcriptional MerR regulator
MNTTLDLAESTNARIGRKALAELAGMRDSTLKFYTEQGLLPYHQAEPGLARRYDRDTAIARLREIEVLQAMGLSIEEIKARLTSEQY